MVNTLTESGLLQGSIEFPIYYEDTDLSGFVYHANYLKFFERAREQLIGISFLRDLFKQGIHFVVSKASLDYRSPAQHADQLIVDSEGKYSRSPAICFDQNAYILAPDGQKRLVVAGQVTIVVLNAQNRPMRMPDFIMQRFQLTQSSETLISTLDKEAPPW